MNEAHETRRREILQKFNDPIPVLDHGFVQLIEIWGSDEQIIEAARMSTNKGFLGWGELRCSCGASSTTGKLPKTNCPTERGGAHVALPEHKMGDEKLLRYLWENKHATPFEMGGATFEIQAPIFVFREWHRHRTQSYNEMSARYTPLPDLNYMPTVERLMANVRTNNKQVGTIAGAELMTEDTALQFQEDLKKIYEEDQKLYEWALEAGVPKELARIHLPVGRYSRMRASTDLRNWLAFLSLRMAPGAQLEIRVYANAVAQIMDELFPRTMELFRDK